MIFDEKMKTNLNNETIDINSPRLIHGSSIRNLEGIFLEGGIMPKIQRKLEGDGYGYLKKPDTNRTSTYFNIAGIPANQLVGFKHYDFDAFALALASATSETESGVAGANDIAKFENWVINRSPGNNRPIFRERTIYEDDKVRVYFGGNVNNQNYISKDGRIFISPILEIKYPNSQSERKSQAFENLSRGIRALPDAHFSESGIGTPYTSTFSYARDTVKKNPDFNPTVEYLEKHIPKNIWDQIDSGESCESGLKLEIPNTVEELRDFDFLGYSGYECFFLIDETGLLKAHKKVVNRAEIDLESENPEVMKQAIEENGDKLKAFYGERIKEVNPRLFRGFLSLCNPLIKTGGCGTALNLNQISELQDMRKDIESQRRGITNTDAHCFEGLYTNYPISIKYIKGIVLTPLERGVVLECHSDPMFKDSLEAVKYMRSLYDKHLNGYTIPIFNMQGELL